jgi:hypothetical protein
MKKIIVGLLIVSGFVFFLFYKGTDESQKAIDFSSLKYKYSKGEERVFNLSQTTEIFFKGQGSSDSNSKFQLKGE